MYADGLKQALREQGSKMYGDRVGMGMDVMGMGSGWGQMGWGWGRV